MQELNILVVHDLDHVVHSSNDIVAEQILGEWRFAGHLSFEDLDKVSDHLWIQEW